MGGTTQIPGQRVFQAGRSVNIKPLNGVYIRPTGENKEASSTGMK